MKIRITGFTLVEMILVVALLGILAVAAIPIFTTSTVTKARSSSMEAAVAAIQSGIAIYAAEQALTGPSSYPGTLDNVANGTWAKGISPLFGTVLRDGITAQWHRKSATCYIYDTNGNSTVDGASIDTYFTYTPATGAFGLIEAGC